MNKELRGPQRPSVYLGEEIILLSMQGI